jgi:hypothetical protein
MAAPTWVSATAQGGGTVTTTCTVTLPTTAANDILIVTVINGGANAAPTLTTGTFSLDTSLALIGSGGGWTSGWGGTYWVRCSGNHSGETIILTGATDSCSMQVARYSGCITTGNPYDTNISEATVAAGANMALAAFNTTVTDTLVVLCNAVDDNLLSTLPTKGGVAMNNLATAASSGGADAHVASASLEQAGTGTTGAFAMTFGAGTNQGKRATAFALKPVTTTPAVFAAGDLTATVVSSATSALTAATQVPLETAAAASSATLTITSGFSPTDIAGLETWLKADAISASDGDPVATWEDSHTSNKDAAQATSGSRPTYQTSEINGLPVVRFDGTDDFMTVAGIVNNDATRTLFCVVRLVALNSGDYVLAFATNAGIRNTSAYQYFANSGGTGVAIGANDVGGAHIIAIRWNSTGSADVYYDSGSATNFDPDDVYQANTPNALHLGSRVAGAIPSQVDFGEVLVYDSALSDTDLDDVRGYLSDKWLAVATPAIFPAGDLTATAVSTATLALTAQTRVSLETATAVSSATLALRATTQVPLGTASAASSATLTLTAPARLSLSATAVSSATLALTAQTRVVLGSSAAVSTATLSLKAQTYIALGTSAAQSSATLTVTAGAGVVAAGPATAVSSATMSLSAATRIVLEAASGTATPTLGLSAATRVLLDAAAADSSATLDLSVPGAADVVLEEASAISSATLAVFYGVVPETTLPLTAEVGENSLTVVVNEGDKSIIFDNSESTVIYDETTTDVATQDDRDAAVPEHAATVDVPEPALTVDYDETQRTVEVP